MSSGLGLGVSGRGLEGLGVSNGARIRVGRLRSFEIFSIKGTKVLRFDGTCEVETSTSRWYWDSQYSTTSASRWYWDSQYSTTSASRWYWDSRRAIAQMYITSLSCFSGDRA